VQCLQPGNQRLSAGQNYPTKPMTMIIPFAAGGPQDQIGRVMAQRMANCSDNRSWSKISAAPAHDRSRRVADAAPDATRSCWRASAPCAGPDLYKRPLYNAATDFTPVALIAETPIALITAKTCREQPQGVCHLRQGNQAKMQYGSAGAGSATHLGCVCSTTSSASTSRTCLIGTGGHAGFGRGRIDYSVKSSTPQSRRSTGARSRRWRS